MQRPWLRVQFFLLLVLFELTCFWAEAQPTFLPNSAASAAAGGAGRAAVEPIDSHFLNPAMLVHLRDRDIHYLMKDNSWLVGMTDNSLGNIVAGGISYASIKEGPKENQYEHKDLRLTLGGFVSQKLAMGMSFRQLESRIEEAKWTQLNADIGFFYAASARIGMGLVVHDAMNSSLEAGEPVRLRPRTALGIHGLATKTMGLRADLVSAPENRFGQPTLLLGYESILNDFVFFRMGWGHDAYLKQEHASVGMGLRLPRFRLNYAYETGIRGDFEVRHSIDLAIPF